MLDCCGLFFFKSKVLVAWNPFDFIMHPNCNRFQMEACDYLALLASHLDFSAIKHLVFYLVVLWHLGYFLILVSSRHQTFNNMWHVALTKCLGPFLG
jgi:hypothetical protein